MEKINIFCEHRALLIYPCPSGYTWNIQAGGIMMADFPIEGILLPIPEAERINSMLCALHPDLYDSAGDCIKFQSTKMQNRICAELADLFIPLTAIKHNDNREALLHVRIEGGGDEILSLFEGKEAILTWKNCD